MKRKPLIKRILFSEAVVHENEFTQERLFPTSLRAVVEAIFKTMEWCDPYTASHQKG